MSTADIGVLADKQESTAPPTTTNRYDVFHEIKKLCSDNVRGGRFCASDIKSDGSSAVASHSLPKELKLHIDDIGEISLPISVNNIEIKSNSWEVDDERTYQIESDKVQIQNTEWETELDNIVRTVAYKLGVNPTDLSANLDTLLYMEEGSRIDRCNNPEPHYILGTLYIQLPSIFSGGEMIVYSGDERENDSEMAKFNLSGTGDDALSCHFVCHYADCEYEMERLKSGSRVLLRYSLHYSGKGPLPTANQVKLSMFPLTQTLESLPQNRKMIILPLHRGNDEYAVSVKYSSSALLNKGIAALREYNRVQAEIIKAAGKSWKILIVNAIMEREETSFGYEQNFSNVDNKYRIGNVFDEDGRCHVSSWLSKVANFHTVAKRDSRNLNKPLQLDDDNAMLLGTKGDDYIMGCSDNWGRCFHQTESSTGNSESDYYGGYGGGYRYNDRDITRTTKQQYSGTFLLAYDTVAEVDLMCLAGVEGVSEVTSNILANQDCNLLDRLLSIIESSSDINTKLDVNSCQQLLEMVTKGTTDNNNINIDRVKRTILGLSTSFEPDDELFGAIISAGDKLGHEYISESIKKLLLNVPRIQRQPILAFLCRANFILEITKRTESQLNCLEENIRALSTRGITSTGEDISLIGTKIIAMIERHGWNTTVPVVNAVLSQLDKIRLKLDQLLEMSLLLTNIEAQDGCSKDFLRSYLVEFASDLSASFVSTSNKRIVANLNTEHKLLLLSISVKYLVEYGVNSDLLRFGAVSCDDEVFFGTLLRIITDQNLMLSFFNKCLVHSSVTFSSCMRWSSTLSRNWSAIQIAGMGKGVIPIPPSIHIRKTLEAIPGLATKADGAGRLPLHYAAASSTASFDAVVDILEANQEAVSISDPVSGLFPFQLAASNDNIGASFRLLCADPNLVLGGIQVDETDEAKKRKRNE